MIRNLMLLMICSLTVSSGCSGRDVPELGTVTGIVTLDGKPLEKAVVMFQPDNARPSRGETDAAGRYTLIYTRESRGAVPGTHSVNIRTRREDDAGNLVLAEFLPNRYHDQTELTANVSPGKNQIDFVLTSAK